LLDFVRRPTAITPWATSTCFHVGARRFVIGPDESRAHAVHVE
jgi:hypothetical protein